MKYYSIMEHSPQCKEPLTLNLEKKKNPPNLTKQRSTWPNKAKSVLHKEYFYWSQHTYSKIHKAREKHNLAISTQHFSGIHMLIYAPVEANS